MKEFVHLHIHTEYSMLDGACRIKELVGRVKTAGQRAAAITDHGVMYGCIDFYEECLKNDVKPIIGCEVNVAARRRSGEKNAFNHLVLLCEDNGGYKNLIKLVSSAYSDGQNLICEKEALLRYSEGLIALSGCLRGEIPRLLRIGEYGEALSTALEYRDVFGAENFYIEAQDHGLKEEREILPLIYKLCGETGIPICATNDAHYLTRADAGVRKILRAIGSNTTIDDEYDNDEYYIKTGGEMAALFSEEAIENTVKIAYRCNVNIELGAGVYKLPFFKKEGVTDNEAYFKERVKEGLALRYGINYAEALPDVKKRADYETGQIEKMGFTDYFLIVADFIDYARENKIPVGPGRGSGVGSLCAYALGITAVDPIRFGLLFERFLNPERISMPDFDIDLCYRRRQEVINYVVKKYGSDHVAQIITFGTMAARAAVRDAGRVMGAALSKVDRIAKLIPFMSDLAALEKEPSLIAARKDDYEIDNLIKAALKIEGMPRHVSIHAAGLVITREPVTEFVPVQKTDGGADGVTTQYAMGNLESLGLLKMDFLGLRYLTIVHSTAAAAGIKDVEKIPEDDTEVYNMLSSGQTSGVFQFESEGVTNLLTRMKPRSIEDLTAAISLYRPGPMASIPRFIESRHNPEKIRYKHPSLEKILSVTYGCVVYQEQVMRICRELAGFSYGKADIVRRAMSKKKAALIQDEREAFINGARANNIDEKTATEIFDELAGFAAYAFNKSHAAAYATLAYKTAYLRKHHFKEYMARLMTSVLESGSKTAEYIGECQKNGVNILPPDVNKSSLEFSARGEGISFSLLAIKNLGAGIINEIVKERENGEYTSLYDFCKRLSNKHLGKRAVEALIKSGALDSLGHKRRVMLMVYEEILDSLSKNKSRSIEGQLDLFGGAENSENSEKPEIFKMPDEAEFNETTLKQMQRESLGVAVSDFFNDFNKQKTLYINLNSSEIEKLARINQILLRYKGAGKARICFSDVREVKLPKGVSGVNITKDLLAELEKLCGKSNIKLK